MDGDSLNPDDAGLLLDALADACGTAQSSVGLFDSRRVTFLVDRSTIVSSKKSDRIHVEALGEMRFDFGIEADGEWTQRETRELVRFMLEVAEAATVGEVREAREPVVGWLIGRWSDADGALMCEPMDEKGRARRVPSPRPPSSHLTFRIERMSHASQRPSNLPT